MHKHNAATLATYPTLRIVSIKVRSLIAMVSTTLLQNRLDEQYKQSLGHIDTATNIAAHNELHVSCRLCGQPGTARNKWLPGIVEKSLKYQATLL
jgi:hypothetical protein